MKKIIIGISGASGIPLAIRLLQILKKMPKIQTHLVISDGGKVTLKHEMDIHVNSLADKIHKNKDLSASIASGTFKSDGMVIIPCSMKTISALSHGYSQNLLLRAGDVTIKEKRKLVLVPRETPFSPIHLENLLKLSKLQNVTILPPMLSYYQKPQNIEDMEDNIIGKILNIFDIDYDGFKRWK